MGASFSPPLLLKLVCCNFDRRLAPVTELCCAVVAQAAETQRSPSFWTENQETELLWARQCAGPREQSAGGDPQSLCINLHSSGFTFESCMCGTDPKQRSNCFENWTTTSTTLPSSPSSLGLTPEWHMGGQGPKQHSIVKATETERHLNHCPQKARQTLWSEPNWVDCLLKQKQNKITTAESTCSRGV